MNETHRLSDLWEAFWNVEQEHDLLHWTINGVYVWPVVRPSVFEHLYRTCFPAETSGLVGGKPTVRTLIGTAAGLTLRHDSPFRARGPYDSIIVPFYRKQLRDGNRTEIHSHRILAEREFGRMLVLDSGGPRDMLPSAPGRDVFSLDALWLNALMRATAVVAAYMPPAIRLKTLLESAFAKRIDANFHLSAFDIALRTAVFAQGRILARRIIRRSGARRLLALSGRGVKSVIAAAQDCGLRTYEQQHGMICKYHAAYHYPGRPLVPYTSENLLTYGSYWQKAADFSANVRTTVIGSENLDYCRNKAVRRISRRVFIPSQDYIGDRLLQFAIDIARKAPAWEIWFRPHPQESLRMVNVIRDCKDFPANFHFSLATEEFYDALAASEVQVGVYSTALFEGMALGLRTIVLDLPGAENMDKAIQTGDAVLARNAAEAVAALATAPRSSDPDAYYAPPVPSIFDALT